MKANLSRNTFLGGRHYSSVRLQQGRIITDADWNEQADITRHRAETSARDVIGPCGVPLDAAGYALRAETNALAVHAPDAASVWVLGQDGVLLASDSGGADWELVELGTAEHLRAAASAGNAGWIVGDAGTVRHTADAGLSWTAQDAGTTEALRAVAVVDASQAWAVGDGGTIRSTIDAGVSWMVQGAGTTGALRAIAAADASRAWAVGDGGAVLATSDGGDSWIPADSGTTAHLRALARVGATHLWVAGDRGTILRSEDAGATWLPCPTPVTVALHAIAFRDAAEGWAAGEDGTLLHSLDGGATWLAEDAGLGGIALRGLGVAGATEPGWAVGEGGAALRVGSGSPDITTVALPAVNLSIGPGRCYVDGFLCELDAPCTYAHQPDGGTGERLGAGVHLLYLDGWQHHVGALSEPSIREVALGGPDTATRARTVAQVRALALPAASPSAWTCGADVPGWDVHIGLPRPRLAVRAEPQLATTNLCDIAATAGYRRLENQLYRVEVHEGGAGPTFKWSRENGSVAYAVTAVTPDSVAGRTTVRVAARGRDASLDLAARDCVELVDDDSELTRRAGTLFEYVEDGDDELELVLAGLPVGTTGLNPARHPVLRRWDHSSAATASRALPVQEGVWIELEDGVQVRFAPGGTYRAGDYWQIPARTITGDVEWPRDSHGDPLAQEPAGIVDAHCRLGIVEVGTDGAVTVLADCRKVFPPLTALEQLHYVSGDGQEAAPGAMLPQPLALRVSRGTLPVAQARLRFQVESGGGLVGDGTGASAEFEVVTDAQGRAGCRWTLGPAASAPGRFQRLRANLLDAGGDPLPGQVIVYCATASLLLQHVSGDGQQAPANAALPHPLQMRVTDGGGPVAGAALSAAVLQGGGQLVGPTQVATGPDGQAAFDWQLGPGGPQRLAVRLADPTGAELQRLEYTATVAAAATAGGGCDITIGPGGQFERLDADLLKQLLEERRGALCLCFMPGEHDVGPLLATGGGESRLSLHGCGPTAILRVHGPIELDKFAALEIRDLTIALAGGRGTLLRGNAEICLASLSLSHLDASDGAPCLHVAGGSRLLMASCVIGSARPAAAIFEELAGDCHIDGNRFEGTVSFYGPPPSEDLSRRYVATLSDMPRMTLGTNDSRLHFSGNDLQLLTIGGPVAEQLLQQRAEGLFRTAVLHGNTFAVQRNVFASGLLSFADNSFIAEPDGVAYGVMIATQATAAGNVAVRVGDEATLHFLTPFGGGFSKAANRVYIEPS